MLPKSSKHEREAAVLTDMEKLVVDWFVDGGRVLGLPKSLGEIYGLLFVSKEPMALDDLVLRLGISKGSASQGLSWLREVGAVKVVNLEGSRKSYFEANIELKKLAAGFISSQIKPHIASGSDKLSEMDACASQVDDEKMKSFYRGRIEKLDQWMRRGKLVLPILQKVLGG